MRLILVRHGETDWNLQGRYQGRADADLCATGLETARRTAATLRGVVLASVLSSPLQRAVSTAAVIAAALRGPSPVIDARLTEIDFGAWQGLTQQQIKTRWPQLLRCWKHAPEAICFPSGESLGDARERLSGFLRDPPWAKFSDSGDVLAVSHAGVIRLAGLIAENRPLRHFREMAVQTGSMHAFEWRAGGPFRRVCYP